MDGEYARVYRQLYEKHWWWRSRERFILRTLHQWNYRSSRPGNHQILDIGCGDGLFFPKLQQFGAVTGIEPDQRLLNAQGPYYSAIHQGPFDETYQPGTHFDWIIMLDVLEHIATPETALAHAVTLLKPGGKLLITVPAFNLLWTCHDDFNHHYTRYTKTTFRNVATSAAIPITSMSYAFHWTFVAKLLIRLREKWFPTSPRPATLPNSPVNTICQTLCVLEQHLTSWFHIPFGSSLVIKAEDTRTIEV